MRVWVWLAFLVAFPTGACRKKPAPPPEKAPAVAHKRKPAAPAPAKLEVRYYTSAETSYTSIHVRQGRLYWATFEDRNGRCRRWVASAPCWTPRDLTRREAKLAATEVNALRQRISRAGILAIASPPAPKKGKRFYSYALSVRLGDKRRNIVYRSFPGAPKRPPAFAAIVAHLQALVKRKFPK